MATQSDQPTRTYSEIKKTTPGCISIYRLNTHDVFAHDEGKIVGNTTLRIANYP